MKQYIKDGEIKTRNQILIRGTKTIKDKDGNERVVNTQIINPTEQMIFDDGWVEYVIELTLDDHKNAKIAEILEYDSSRSVNVFYIQQSPMWLDKQTRTGLMLRFQSEQMLGKTTTTLWYENTMYTLPLYNALNILYALEGYASACYDNTHQHIANVKNLDNIDDVKNYDYTTGYPEHLYV